MKEKKFRLWDKKNKRIIYEDVSVCINLDGEVSEHHHDYRFELMQWSGLQDSKGVDIYEGDVVYLAGYGSHEVEFPFIQLYEAGMENDIGEVLYNIYEGLS